MALRQPHRQHLGRLSRVVTVGTLSGVSALHVAWGRGSSFPFGSAVELTDKVVGSTRPPSSAACYSVAGLLGAGAVLAAVPPRWPIHRWALRAGASAVATRAIAGFAGRTDLLIPGSRSAPFRRRDRLVYSPLCALLALGLAGCSRRHQGE